jgi:hypothetical protein
MNLTSIGDFAYFALIYNWLSVRIIQFGSDVMGRAMNWVSALALILVTLWVVVQGWRLLTGQSRESMTAMIASMTRIAVVVTVASSMALGSVQLQHFFTTDLARSINELVTGSYTSPPTASRPGPQGQPPGVYGGYGGNAAAGGGLIDSGRQSASTGPLNSAVTPRPVGTASTALSDTVKPYQGGTELRA